MNDRVSNDWQETTMTKIVIIECMDLSFTQSFQVGIPYDSSRRQLDLGHSLHQILKNILHYDSHLQIFYFHPGEQLFQYAGIFPFKYPLLIGQDFIAQQQITVRIRHLNIETEHPQVLPKQEKEEKQKKKRVGSRTIREVLQKVSQWRQISQKNSKINLEEGAKIIGIPKKTLDDYYAHIKLGSQYKFPFENNLNQKIGVLRRFVREKNTKRKQSNDFEFIENVLKIEQCESDEQQEQQG